MGLILQHDVGNLSAADRTPQTISEKPWSDYSESDYTLEQWHDACLIHMHDSGDYTKSDCKLPVKTPDGTVNKNGVFAAASALAGGRGGVDASPEQKTAAAKSLVTLYGKIGAKVPPSITQLAHGVDVGKFIEHHGVKGQKWGIRNRRTRSSTAKSLSDDEITKRIKRMELEKRFTDLSKQTESAGKKYATELLQNSGKAVVGTAIGTGVSFVVGRALKARFG